VTAQIDPRARTTNLAYDALNQITRITDAIGGQTSFTYDSNGNLLTVTDAKKNTVRYEYNSMDRLVRRVDPLSRAESFAYDANGNLSTATDRKGQVTRFTYDALDRRVEASYADGALATFQYDAVSRLVRADDSADPHRPITLAYDDLDRLEVETTSLGSVRYAYDRLGRRTQMEASGAPAVAYTYDRSSRLRTITQAPLTPASIDYDAADRRTRLTLPNGVSTEYLYDAASRLTELIYRNALAPLGNLTYQYDSSGNRVGVGGSLARSQLPDPVSPANYDAANQQLQFGDRLLTYDSNGNLESITEPAGLTRFTWDARNRLVNLTAPGTTGAFSYDAFGRRAAKDVNGRSSLYAYDGLDFISEIADGLPLSYLRTLFIDEALVRNGTDHYIADALGSTVALTNSSGALTTQYTYEPFGNTSAFGIASENSAQYTGRENDGTGLYFYRARYYNPTLQRFIGEDPLEFGGGDVSRRLSSGDLNMYSYVGNVPTSFVDPLGLKSRTSSPGMLMTLADAAVNAVADFAAGRTSSCGGIYPGAERDYGTLETKTGMSGRKPGSDLDAGGKINWRLFPVRARTQEASTQDWACYVHDLQMGATGKHFLMIWDRGVAKAHMNLARNSPRPLMRELFRVLGVFDQFWGIVDYSLGPIYWLMK
jgi:RHS repeat-associated protein